MRLSSSVLLCALLLSPVALSQTKPMLERIGNYGSENKRDKALYVISSDEKSVSLWGLLVD
jgi:hypothetical protein